MMPSAPSLPSGSDRVQGASGITCESTVAPDAYVDVGVYNQQNDRKYDSFNNNYNSSYDDGDAGIYARMVIPLGGPKKRVDCTRLYDMELQRLKAEIEMLRMQKDMGSVWDE